MALSAGPPVVLTRAVEDNRELAEALRARGVPVREVPCLATRHVLPPALPPRPAAVVFTSRRGVQGLCEQGLWRHWIEAGAEPGAAAPLVAAVGRATAVELQRFGIRADLIADPPQGKVLAALLCRALPPGAAIGLVRGNLRAGGLDELLERAGFCLSPVQVYENFAPPVPRLEPSPVAAVFVASPSAARRLLEQNGWLRQALFVTLGATTGRALRELEVAEVREVGSDLGAWVEALYTAYTERLRSAKRGENHE